MSRIARVLSTSVGVVLLLVAAFTLRAVLLHRLPAPSLVVQNPTSGPDENLRQPEPRSMQPADEAFGASAGVAPSRENVAALTGASSASPQGSTSSAPASAAVARELPVADLGQTAPLRQGPPAPAAPSRVAPKAAASRPAAGGGPGPERRTDLALVRAWARANGYTVADRGRVAAAILAAYDRAH